MKVDNSEAELILEELRKTALTRDLREDEYKIAISLLQADRKTAKTAKTAKKTPTRKKIAPMSQERVDKFDKLLGL